jgi:hypothetical protein
MTPATSGTRACADGLHHDANHRQAVESKETVWPLPLRWTRGSPHTTKGVG